MTTYKLRILPLFYLLLAYNASSCKKKDMSLKLNKPHNIRGVVSYKRSFPDLNDAHLEVAKKIGISRWQTEKKRSYERKVDSYH